MTAQVDALDVMLGQMADHVRSRDARIAELEAALKALLDENSSSMLVRNFDGWHAAVERARAVLENK